MSDQEQITPQEALDWLRDWERQAFGRRGEWYARIIACVERLVAEQESAARSAADGEQPAQQAVSSTVCPVCHWPLRITRGESPPC